MSVSSSPFEPLLTAAMGKTLTGEDRGRLGQDVPRDARRVVDRGRVGHGADRRETAAGRGPRARGDRLLAFESGLAEVGVHVDEARDDDQPGGVDDPGGRGLEPGPDRGDPPVVDQDVEGVVGSATPGRPPGRS